MNELILKIPKDEVPMILYALNDMVFTGNEDIDDIYSKFVDDFKEAMKQQGMVIK